METAEHVFFYLIAILLFLLIDLHQLVDLWEGLFLVGIGLVSTTMIDIDHFLIESYKTGSVEKFILAIRKPFKTFTNNDHLGLEVTSRERMIFHVFIGLGVSAIAYMLITGTANVFYQKAVFMFWFGVVFHILMDFIADRLS